MGVYSHSRLGTFETCPRQYWFAYIEKPEIARPDTVEAFFGSRVHEALEHLYFRLLNGRLLTQEELRDYYETLWQKAWSDDVRIVKADLTADDYRAVGQQCLRDYYARYHPFDRDRTLVLENLILFNLDPEGQYKIRGFIDRLARESDGRYAIHDYKTSGHLPTQDQADEDRQLALYQIGVQDMWDDVEEVNLVWHYLRFDAELRSCRTPEQLAALKAECSALIDDIEARGEDEEDFPTSRSNLCDWCDYQELCPVTRHHVTVAALPPRKFKADEGVQLVDRWAALRQQIGELEEQVETIEAEEEELKEALLEFARQQGLESIAGSTHYVEVTEKTKIDYPKSDDEGRDAFEATLRDAGLWDEVTAMHWARFRSLWLDEDAWPAGVREHVAPLISEWTETDVRLKQGGVKEN